MLIRAVYKLHKNLSYIRIIVEYFIWIVSAVILKVNNFIG